MEMSKIIYLCTVFFTFLMPAKSIKKIVSLVVWIWGISSFVLYSSAVAQRVYEYPFFQGRGDSVFLHFEDTLRVSAEGDFHYLYRWDVDGEKTGEESDFNIFFTGRRKTRVTYIPRIPDSV